MSTKFKFRLFALKYQRLEYEYQNYHRLAYEANNINLYQKEKEEIGSTRNLYLDINNMINDEIKKSNCSNGQWYNDQIYNGFTFITNGYLTTGKMCEEQEQKIECFSEGRDKEMCEIVNFYIDVLLKRQLKIKGKNSELDKIYYKMLLIPIYYHKWEPQNNMDIYYYDKNKFMKLINKNNSFSSVTFFELYNLSINDEKMYKVIDYLEELTEKYKENDNLLMQINQIKKMPHYIRDKKNSTLTDDNLKKITMIELKKIAKEKKISNYTKMNKSNLINALTI